MPYGDFEMTLTEDPNYIMEVDEQTRYLTTAGLNAQQTVVDPNTITRYFHGDLIDSAMLTTDPNGIAMDSLAYTAFGELVGDPNGLNTRYQYAGGYGYESDLLTLDGVPGSAPITLQHVGARWYQPNIGRFIQRDPIGIMGGLNLYIYCDANPLNSVDPLGLYGWAERHARRQAAFLNRTDRVILWITGGPTGSNWWSDFWDDRSTVNASNVATAAEIASLFAPMGVCVRIVSMGGKAVRVAKNGWWIERKLLKLRKYIRFDPPHHGKGRHIDGDWIKRIRGWF